MHNKKVLIDALKKLGSAKAPSKPRDIITDPMGQWKFPGQNTRIPSNDITMEGVPYPVYAQPNVGPGVMMYPGQDYHFPDADYVDETPQMKAGGALLTKKVTCKKCGWKWDAADGGDDITTCHKCGGQGLVHAQGGGDTDAMNGMMKARLAYANEFGNPAAKRMINLPDNPYQFDNGDTGTHYMASMDNYAVPQIQDEDGQLMLGDYGPESDEAMRFESDEDANYFAKNYKDVSPGFMNIELTPKEIEEYTKGGYIIEDISVPELTKAQDGLTKKTLAIADPKEYAYRKKAYDDSLNLYNFTNNRHLEAISKGGKLKEINDPDIKRFLKESAGLGVARVLNADPNIRPNKFYNYIYSNGEFGGGSMSYEKPKQPIGKIIRKPSDPNYVPYKENGGELTKAPGGGEVARILKNLTRTNNVISRPIKKIGYNIAAQSALPYRTGEEIRKGILGTSKDKYFGQVYDTKNLYGPGKRDLNKLYFFGDETGFEPIDYDFSSDTGLNKMVEKYGPLKAFLLNSTVQHNEPLNAFDLGQLLPNDIKYNINFHELNNLFEKHESDIIPFEINSKDNWYTSNPINPIDNIAGHMAFLKRLPNEEFELTTRDLWGFRPEAYNDKWKMDNVFKKAQTQMMDKFGKPFVLTQTNPIEFQKGGILPEAQYGKFMEKLSKLASVTKPINKSSNLLKLPGLNTSDKVYKNILKSNPNLLDDFLIESQSGFKVARDASDIKHKIKNKELDLGISAWSPENVAKRSGNVLGSLLAPPIYGASSLLNKYVIPKGINTDTRNNIQTHMSQRLSNQYYNQFLDPEQPIHLWDNNTTFHLGNQYGVDWDKYSKDFIKQHNTGIVNRDELSKNNQLRDKVKNWAQENNLQTYFDDDIKDRRYFDKDNVEVFPPKFKLETPLLKNPYESTQDFKNSELNLVKMGPSFGMDMSRYEIKNPDYFTQLLKTYNSKILSPTNKKFYKDLIETVKKQNGLATDRQFNELQRLKTGNFDFGKKNKDNIANVINFDYAPKLSSAEKLKVMFMNKVDKQKLLADKTVNEAFEYADRFMKNPEYAKRFASVKSMTPSNAADELDVINYIRQEAGSGKIKNSDYTPEEITAMTDDEVKENFFDAYTYNTSNVPYYEQNKLPVYKNRTLTTPQQLSVQHLKKNIIIDPFSDKKTGVYTANKYGNSDNIREESVSVGSKNLGDLFNVTVHEALGHGKTFGNVSFTQKEKELLKSVFKNNNSASTYIKEPTEVMARIDEIRSVINKDNPFKEITENDLDRFESMVNTNKNIPGAGEKGSSMLQFISNVDKSKLKKVMNTMYGAAIIGGAAGLMNNPWKQESSVKLKEGGALPEAPGGGQVSKIIKDLSNLTAGKALRTTIYKGVNPANYNVMEKFTGLPSELYRNTVNNSTRPFRTGLSLRFGSPDHLAPFLKDINMTHTQWNKLPEIDKMNVISAWDNGTLKQINDVGRRRLDAWAVALKQPQEYNTLEQIGDNKYRMLDLEHDPEFFGARHNDIIVNDMKGQDFVGKRDILMGLTKNIYDLEKDPFQLQMNSDDPLANLKRSDFDKQVGNKVLHKPWQQTYYVEPSPNSEFETSIYDNDHYGVRGGYRWDLKDTPEGMHWQANDVWDLNPWEKRTTGTLKPHPLTKKYLNANYFKPLQNVEALGLVGGSPFSIENNFIVDPENYKIIKQWEDGGSVDYELGDEIDEATMRRLEKLGYTFEKV